MQLDELAPDDRPSNDRYTGDVRSVSCALIEAGDAYDVIGHIACLSLQF